jgi:hypothetical protein
MRSFLLTNPLTWVTAVAIAATLFIGFAWHQALAADEYKFLVRGDVVEIDKANKTSTVNSRHVGLGAAGENDLAGKSVEMNINQAIYYKYDSKLNKVRTTLGSLNVGDEVVVSGAKKSGGNYTVGWIVRNDHKVNLRGIVQGHDVSNGILEIDIDKLVRVATGKAYQPKIFVAGQRVKVYYDKDSTKFFSRAGKEMEPDQIANNNEKITVEGIDVRFGSRFVAGPEAKVTDDKYKF